jgi:hypothetical protein
VKIELVISIENIFMLPEVAHSSYKIQPRFYGALLEDEHKQAATKPPCWVDSPLKY